MIYKRFDDRTYRIGEEVYGRRVVRMNIRFDSDGKLWQTFVNKNSCVFYRLAFYELNKRYKAQLKYWGTSVVLINFPDKDTYAQFLLEWS